MPQIMEYKLLMASSAEKLSEQVRELLKSAWQPHEAPSMMQIGGSAIFQMVFIQAMVKYKQ